MKRALVIVSMLTSLATGCALGKQMLAPSDDLEAYRAFRVAESKGTRLARAQHYLEAHPRGRWTEEVRAAFDTEEQAYFEEAQSSREKALRYLTELPRGPHAEAVLSAIVAIEHHVADEELDQLIREVRRRDAKLGKAQESRRQVTERLMDALGALLDERVYGATIERAPAELKKALSGNIPSTWGAVPARRGEDFFFILPSATGSDSRYLRVEVAVVLEGGHIVEGRVEGEDLLVRWAEAQTMESIDPTTPDGRAAAAAHAVELLGGAFEGHMPEARCKQAPGPGEVLSRACDGWEAHVRMDAIVVRGPRIQ